MRNKILMQIGRIKNVLYRAYKNIPKISKSIKEPEEIIRICKPGGRFSGCITKWSKPIEKYTGSLEKNIGFSTQVSCRDGQLFGNWDTPLSTSGIYNCAVVILKNTKTKEHYLYHSCTYSDDISKDLGTRITKFFKDFDNAYIIPGSNEATESSINSFYKTIKSIKPDINVEFMHFPKDGVEVVSHKKGVYYIPRETPDVTFQKMETYVTGDISKGRNQEAYYGN